MVDHRFTSKLLEQVRRSVVWIACQKPCTTFRPLKTTILSMGKATIKIHLKNPRVCTLLITTRTNNVEVSRREKLETVSFLFYQLLILKMTKNKGVIRFSSRQVQDMWTRRVLWRYKIILPSFTAGNLEPWGQSWERGPPSFAFATSRAFVQKVLIWKH